jgi:hypothetical protein
VSSAFSRAPLNCSVQTSKTWRFINFTLLEAFRNSPSELLFMVEVEKWLPYYEIRKSSGFSFDWKQYQQSPCKTNTPK